MLTVADTGSKHHMPWLSCVATSHAASTVHNNSSG